MNNINITNPYCVEFLRATDSVDLMHQLDFDYLEENTKKCIIHLKNQTYLEKM